ncbi:BrnA antitoxin family protein [Rhodoferax sp.]|uniref:BrnA antitoxin family protein n=1 Tax=Rhodoferax sp. TaxID=50421 RepID=UPI002609DABF|nr:BrnA antitoxin family protein [Rhodoferax sp.]MDD2917681.1 BrnA antitoxin family protein [Rhodoferax sp.]
MKPTVRSRRVLEHPTPAEDAAIAAGIAQDTDTYEPSDREFATMRRPGRPMGSGTKTQITLRLDTVVVEKFKATGEGWQTRINEVLRALV